jgi:hypothetical protein
MRYYITFRQGSPYKDMFKIIEADSWEAAHDMARRDYPRDYSMVYAETGWVDYRGLSQQARFNLKELK